MMHPKYRCARRLQHIGRWAVVPTIKKQSVAEHCHGVALAVMWIIDQLEYQRLGAITGFSAMRAQTRGDIYFQALMYASLHDNSEAITGDIPAPIPKTVTDPDCSTVLSKKIVKLADKLEAYLYIKEEKLLGNQFITPQLEEDVYSRIRIAAIDLGAKESDATDLAKQWIDGHLTRDKLHPLMDTTSRTYYGC